jgi:hypothetical protein
MMMPMMKVIILHLHACALSARREFTLETCCTLRITGTPKTKVGGDVSIIPSVVRSSTKYVAFPLIPRMPFSSLAEVGRIAEL